MACLSGSRGKKSVFLTKNNYQIPDIPSKFLCLVLQRGTLWTTAFHQQGCQSSLPQLVFSINLQRWVQFVISEAECPGEMRRPGSSGAGQGRASLPPRAGSSIRGSIDCHEVVGVGLRQVVRLVPRWKDRDVTVDQ